MNFEHNKNTVSKLFLGASIIMILTYPGFKIFLPQYPTIMIGSIAILSVLAGLTNFKNRFISILDIIISLFAIGFFEDHAIMFARNSNLIGIFLTDQILVLIFVIALYFSVKSLRRI